MKRRDFFWGTGAACAAAACGIGFGLWREHQTARQLTRDEKLWSLQFDRPEGGMLQMSAFHGKPLLLNFWATWCPPCLKEMPLLNDFHLAHGGQDWQVVALAVDNLEAVRSYLKRSSISLPIGMAGFAGLDLALELGNNTRQLPFSVIFDRQGQVTHRKLGSFTLEDLPR